jgi:hypothetical protein
MRDSFALVAHAPALPLPLPRLSTLAPPPTPQR